MTVSNEIRWGGKFRPYFHRYSHSAKFRVAIAPKPLSIKQVGKAYNFPTGLDGTGQTIGIVELGGGYTSPDLEAAIPGLTARTSWFGVDGGSMQPGQEADSEVLLDIQVSGVLAPKATVIVAFAPNTEQGFVDAVNDLVAKRVDVISISWGGPENAWTGGGLTSLNQAIANARAVGIEVCVAIGDNGYSDGSSDGSAQVDFPGSSPFAVACGGTALYVNSNGSIHSEYVWNDLSAGGGSTGGGVSQAWPLPPYQSGCQVLKINGSPMALPMRGVPDLALNAAPSTGYLIWINGAEEPIGGTSAVAPALAAFIALVRQKIGGPIPGGFLNKIYAHRNTPTEEAYFHESISGNNGLYQSVPHRWDACTGLGSFNGAAVLNLLAS